jgi:hypothetical protein
MEVRPAHALATRLSFFKLKQPARAAKSIPSQRLVGDHAGEPRQRNIKDQCGEAPVHAYAAIDVIDWPGGFYCRDIGWRALACGPVQSKRITSGSMRF